MGLSKQLSYTAVGRNQSVYSGFRSEPEVQAAESIVIARSYLAVVPWCPAGCELPLLSKVHSY